jgi:hypothetical protein
MAIDTAKAVRRSQRRKKEKYSDYAKPRRRFKAWRAQKNARPKAEQKAKREDKVVAADLLRIHGGKVCTSSGLATAMKRDLTAWIKAERMVRELRAQIAQLPVGDPTSVVGPRFKDPIFNRHAEAKDSARECEKKVRKNERDMRSGAWRPVDINEALLTSSKTRKEVAATPPTMEALGFD